MSEATAAPAASSDGNSGPTSPAPQEFAPITSQDDLNKIIRERIDRERAKFADYADVKAKAAQLDKIEEANKSEAQKLADQVAQAEARAQAAESGLLRERIAREYGITDQGDVDLFLTGNDEETLKKQAVRLSERTADASKPRSPRPDPAQGRPQGGAASTADQFAAAVGGLL